MQAANRSAIRSRFSTSRSASTPPSDDNSPPSNLATTALPATGDSPGSGSVWSVMAGWPRRNGADWRQHPNPKPAQQLVPRPPTRDEFCGLESGELVVESSPDNSEIIVATIVRAAEAKPCARHHRARISHADHIAVEAGKISAAVVVEIDVQA